MKILSIETSCDETAIAIIEAMSIGQKTSFTVLGNALISQIDIHRAYGGVFPALAKREHAKNLVPLLEASLEEAEMLHEDRQIISEEKRTEINEILTREPGLAEAFFAFTSECEVPEIDTISVTSGPGLEPALWVGINFARALSLLWNKPLVAVNHMEGHILSALAKEAPRELVPTPSISTRLNLVIENVQMPVLALLISGGHTELVLMKEWLTYELIGQTRDDAVGEAFDKVARMLGLPYPGGPEISHIAEDARKQNMSSSFELPRPMLHEASCDFSFSGLKTAVLTLIKNKNILTDGQSNVDTDSFNQEVALEFENAVTDVLLKKTIRALEETGAKTLVIGGGVSANTHIRRSFTELVSNELPHITLSIPDAAMTGDNAIMIGLAGFYRASRGEFVNDLKANGNLPLA